jgi:hypothetical protein
VFFSAVKLNDQELFQSRQNEGQTSERDMDVVVSVRRMDNSRRLGVSIILTQLIYVRLTFVQQTIYGRYLLC